jgi:hypothetical protein
MAEIECRRSGIQESVGKVRLIERMCYELEIGVAIEEQQFGSGHREERKIEEQKRRSLYT